MALSFDDRGHARPLSIARGEPLVPANQPGSLAEGITGGISLFPAGRFASIDERGGSVSTTYGDTLARARRILGGLRARGIKPGDTLILYFSRWADFLPVLWAALLGGAIPVPIMRSDWNRGHATRMPKVFAHLRNVLQAPRVLGDPLDETQRDALGIKAGDTIALADLEASAEDGAYFEGPPDAPALLVLSSGTTAAPNLVTLSARALINRWWPAMPDPENAATFLSWSPFDHVMGLGLAGPNLPTKVHLPTNAFVQSPSSWLTAIERFRVTHCTMTNFGMGLVEGAARAPGQTWDLSSVRKIGVGAEAVSPDMCRRFMAALQPFGLRGDALILGYGLTECGPVVGGATVFGSARGRGAGPFAVLDKPTRGHAVRIVDGGELVPEGEVGAVEVMGPTMALGYWGDEAATRALFTADGWIRTGDLGRLDDGQLTITGREKEIIVIRAKKYACSEIEAAAETVGGVTAAFAVAGDASSRSGHDVRQDHFAVFFVPSPAAADHRELARGVRAAVAARFGLAPGDVVPVGADAVPRTASGKVRRLELAARLAGGEFDAAIAATSLAAASARAPLSQTERKIAAIWADILNLPDCGRDEDFFELGGDSLSAEVLVLAIERQFGKRLPPQLLQGRTTIASLAVFVDGGPTVSAAAAGASTRRRTIARKRDAETLAWSLKVAKSLTASLFDRVYAVEFLVAYGMVEQAAAALRTLKAVLAQHRLSSPHVMDRLVAVTSRFRRMGIRQSVEKLGPLGQRLLSGSEESVLCAVPGGDRLLVVFNSMYGDFWVSTPVLHCLIRDERTNILYLKDPSERIFAGGLPAFGPDFDALVRGISETADKLGVGDIRVMGFSAGGYAALLAAARLNATAFAGFSIRTDLAPGSPLPGSQFATPENRVADDVYLDLEPILAAGTPKRAVLYYGENERADVLHAERLAHLPQFTLKRLPSTLHNTVLTLLAEGEFERAIRTLLH